MGRQMGKFYRPALHLMGRWRVANEIETEDELGEGSEAQRIFGEKERKWENNEKKIGRKIGFFKINHQCEHSNLIYIYIYIYRFYL